MPGAVGSSGYSGSTLTCANFAPKAALTSCSGADLRPSSGQRTLARYSPPSLRCAAMSAAPSSVASSPSGLLPLKASLTMTSNVRPQLRSQAQPSSQTSSRRSPATSSARSRKNFSRAISVICGSISTTQTRMRLVCVTRYFGRE